ncbi:MAG: 3-deoxy-7-phosphoheptulonate synthase [Opitutales bacterium]|nr:3-deoxy-7-phosphoheptulonate synthase [Opitutales bacterium]
MTQITNVNVVDSAVLPAPEYLCREFPCTEEQTQFISNSRQEISEIIFGDDNRFLVVLGPCSIHDLKAGYEYAERLAKLSKQVEDRMLLVMRVYFEKPRTTVGWKGLIMDPNIDKTYNIPLGLKLARQFLRSVLDLKLPTATELLDPITPQYISDLISWSAIGARTSESQTHRQMASGLSMPLGFKNSTAGDLIPAINAIRAASQPQTFLGISFQGLASSITTCGNKSCHVILRGGAQGPNYSKAHINEARDALVKNNLKSAIMVDCSHDNCHKDPTEMPNVFADVIETAKDVQSGVIGAMLESNLVAGSQSIPPKGEKGVYGQSITDPCIDWAETEHCILKAYEDLAPRFA